MLRLASLIIVTTVLVGCAAPSGERFGEVRPGMHRDEVIATLGEPSSRHRVPANEVALRGYAERFHYGDTPGSFASRLVFRDLPDPRVWVVFLDGDGRVVGTREPEPEDELPPRRLETSTETHR